MTASDDPLSAQLHTLAERWLERPLSAAETQELARFRQSLERGGSAGPPAGQAAAQAIRDARAQAQAAMRDVLDGARRLAQRMASEREQEDRAILRMVESAGSLAELRPSALPPDGQDSPAGRILIAQIADRLANLVRAEVQECFERQLAPLASRVEALLREVRAAAAPPTPAAPPARATPDAPSAPPPPGPGAPG
ncbi:hypothetical protein QFW77_17800 [Luteimonas sp. RD2P54]|uniref:DUF2486 family protein n=1 Tax=Luteimonas endophytica TaxID=3042023 RepID=A0ABT6JDY1_9GAMM|nr:hypothetical protein [Luteimonas endophytica]MDH5824827.1 hypothetical protein [Luteimonas endophytica]